MKSLFTCLYFWALGYAQAQSIFSQAIDPYALIKVPLNTMSNWGWHSFPNPNNYTLHEVMCLVEIGGKTEIYAMIRWPYELDYPAGEWLNKNPHRFHLGQLGLVLLKQMEVKHKSGVFRKNKGPLCLCLMKF